MTNKFKKRVHARMQRTGESYQTARRLLESRQPQLTDEPHDSPPFSVWLAEQSDRDDPIGDLARDARADLSWPHDLSSLAEFESHLASKSASRLALVALRDAWAEWAGWPVGLVKHRECVTASFQCLLTVFMWVARLPVPGRRRGQYMDDLPRNYPNAADMVVVACEQVLASRRRLREQGVPEHRILSEEASVWATMPATEALAKLEAQRELDRPRADFGPRLVRECNTAIRLIRLMPDQLDFGASDALSELIAWHGRMQPDGSVPDGFHCERRT